jgi:hypothetical protein
MNSPFAWMPKPGQSVKIPGGVLWCEEWKCDLGLAGMVEGEIRFRFVCDAQAYRDATEQKQPTEIEGQPMRLLS